MYEKLQNMTGRVFVVVNYLHTYICRHTHLRKIILQQKHATPYFDNIACDTSKYI